MPTFDREAAKAAGYSDSEIRAMVAAGPPGGAPQAPQGHPLRDALVEGGLGLLPAAGGLAGGVLGTAAGPLGTIGGAGLGAAGGEAWRQNISRMLGLDSPETGLGAAGQIAGQGALGAGFAALPVAGGAAMKAASEAAGANPRIAGVLGKFMMKKAAGPVGDIADLAGQLSKASRAESAAAPAEAKIAGTIKPRPSLPKPKPKPARAAKPAAPKPRPSRPMQGASTPELVRRSKNLSPKIKEVVEDNGLESKLAESLKLVEKMKDRGLTPSEIGQVFRAGTKQ